MKRILIAPFSKNTPSGKPCAKNYPLWPEVVAQLQKIGYYVIQISCKGEESIHANERHDNLPFKDLLSLLNTCDLWLSVDSFFQHFAHYHNKRGIVLWSKSDPQIFGYPENINLLKDRKFLRKHQFRYWEGEIVEKESFVDPLLVVNTVVQWFKG